jgi:hypothetical protein
MKTHSRHKPLLYFFLAIKKFKPPSLFLKSFSAMDCPQGQSDGGETARLFRH